MCNWTRVLIVLIEKQVSVRVCAVFCKGSLHVRRVKLLRYPSRWRRCTPFNSSPLAIFNSNLHTYKFLYYILLFFFFLVQSSPEYCTLVRAGAEKCRIGYEEQKEWYFFSHKDKKYPSGTRTNRATMAGFWKATGRDKEVYDRSKLIGMRKTLVFYKGRAPNGQKTNWIMHEYRLDSPPQEEGWVGCRAFKKCMSGQSKSSSNEGWDVYYDKPPPKNMAMCKEEVESLHFAEELPQLETPMPLAMESNVIRRNTSKKVMDWRDLDKFVAWQLSHGGGGAADDHSQTGLLLLQGEAGREEEPGPNFNHLTTSDSDFGLCIFNN